MRDATQVWTKGRKELRPACGSCGCKGFRYIPKRPEEIGVGAQAVKGFEDCLGEANGGCHGGKASMCGSGGRSASAITATRLQVQGGCVACQEHEPNGFRCRSGPAEKGSGLGLRVAGCGCHCYTSAWQCITCEGKWEDHESLWENEEERRLLGRPVGQAGPCEAWRAPCEAFMPLASTPDVRHLQTLKKKHLRDTADGA